MSDVWSYDGYSNLYVFEILMAESSLSDYRIWLHFSIGSGAGNHNRPTGYKPIEIETSRATITPPVSALLALTSRIKLYYAHVLQSILCRRESVEVAGEKLILSRAGDRISLGNCCCMLRLSLRASHLLLTVLT